MNNQISDNSPNKMGGGEVSSDWVILSDDELAEVTGGLDLVPTEGNITIDYTTTNEFNQTSYFQKTVTAASLGYTTNDDVKNTVDDVVKFLASAEFRGIGQGGGR